LPLVKLAQGAYTGRRENGLAVFRGIPYAAPPFGPRRFLAPQAVQPTAGVVDAGAFAPASPQAPRDWQDNQDLVGGDNCLTLNVWTGSAPLERRPVLVWIPGGGFMRGSASDPLYDGASFAQRGLVVVSLNYRLGVDGFMQLPGAVANRGLLDQMAALRWVRDHIEAFGGDPDAITVGGSSAGAGALSSLLGLPASRGLFRRIILQSPSVSCQSPEEAAQAAQAIASLLGVPPTQQGMAAVPLAASVRAVARLAADHGLRQKLGLGSRNFLPLRQVMDGALLKQLPLQALQAAWQAPDRPALDVLVGANAEEMRFYLVPDGEIDRIDLPRLHDFARACGLGLEAVQLYADARPGASPGDILCAMQSDYYYREPARRIAALASAAGLAVRHYDFAWRSPLHEHRLGAAHALELPFVFNTLRSPQGVAFAGDDPPRELARRMHEAWVEFATTGQVSGWPVSSASDALSMRFDGTSSVVKTAVPRETSVWRF
jgi:para-nitrobenzyl esterase